MIMVYGINYYSIAKKEKNIKKKAYYESTVNIGALTGFIAVIVIVTVTILDMAKGYHRSDWMVEIKQEINNIVIPAFGGLTGKVPCDVIAKMMFLAYKQIYNQPKELNWGYALHITKELWQ